MKSVEDILNEAIQHHEARRLPQAEQSYRQILQTNPRHPDAMHLLGVLYYQRGQNKSAVSYICQAISVQPNCAAYHNNLGLVYRQDHKYTEARDAHLEAIRVDPAFASAYANLAWTYQQLNQSNEARNCYQQAIQYRPTFAAYHFGLGKVLQEMGRPESALVSFAEALRLEPEFAAAHHSIGEVQQDLGRLQEALASYELARQYQPDNVEFHFSVIQILDELGRHSEAQESWEQPIRSAATDGTRVRILMSTPAIFQSVEQMHRQRQRLMDGLEILSQTTLRSADPLAEVNSTNFYAAYHGLNDRDLQIRLARMFQRSTPSLNFVAPHCENVVDRDSDRQLRVGFVSRFFEMHTIGEVTLGIIRELSRKVCQVVLLPLSESEDDISRYIRASADKVVQLPPRLDEARRIIAEQQLDVLFYTDIGMDPFTYFLAFSRLAPVQCVTWGHPVTTGIPTIDYYISSDDQEPPDADSHYSERLVRLPGLPTYYIPPAVFPPARTRAYFGLNEEAHYYLCTQAPFKVHPDFDAILREILRTDPRGCVLFIRGHNPSWTHELIRRLRRTMSGEFERIRFLPHQGGQDYLKLLPLCDALLDTTCFSGGNTALKALSVGAPIVTLPGEFARGRTTFACYQKMGLLDCVANDPADYVRIAVRLATDHKWRQHVCDQIVSSRHVLYEDAGIVRAIENFFVEAFDRKISEQAPAVNNNLTSQLSPQGGISDRDSIDRFHAIYYDSGAWDYNQYLGFPIKQCPLDLQIYQELIYNIRPKFVLQTGIGWGGSLQYFATMLDLIQADASALVVGVDIVIRPEACRLNHPRIRLIEGDSTDPKIVSIIESMLPTGGGMVSLDSDHSAQHVAAELRIYREFVALQSYLVTEDTNVNGHPVLPGFGPGPMEAVNAFLLDDKRFIRDDEVWRRNLFSFHQGGWLKRIG